MIKIKVGSTSFMMRCDAEGFLGNGSFYVKPYIDIFLSEYIYENEEKKLVCRYLFYDKNTKEMFFPRYFLDHFTKLLGEHNKEYEITYIPPNKSKKIKINLNPGYSDRENQAPIINYLVKSDNTMRCVSLQTGFGKTYIALKAATKLKETFLVITLTYLIPQWEKEILSITNLTKDNIYILQGKKSIETIVNDPKKDYKCYIGSLSTIINYIRNNNNNYNDFISFYEFMRELKIGVKIVDECHLNFYKNVILDTISNIGVNIYLSATFVRNNKSGNLIFQNIFPHYIRYTHNEYKRYVNITEYNYSIGLVNEKAVTTKYGYNQAKYEKFIFTRLTKLDAIYNVISSVFYNKYVSIKQPKDRCLILVKTKIFATKISERLRSEYTSDEFVIDKYLYETPKDELETLDVIVSTIGSCGVGKDIKNLRTVILFDSFKSESWIYQTLGRLRQLEDRIPEFAYLQNTDISSHMFHRRRRRELFKNLSNNYQTITL